MKLKKILLAFLLTIGLTTTIHAMHDVQILTADNTKKKITPQTIEAAFEKAGFFINDNRDMNVPFKNHCKRLQYQTYNLFTVFKKDVVLKLVKKYPNIGLFSPMSMSIYSENGSNTISVSSLSAAAMAKIMGIPADDADLVAYGKLVQDTLRAALPNAKVEKVSYDMKKPEGDLVWGTTLTFDGDWEDTKDDFEMEFEGSLAPYTFVMAGFNDLNYDFEEAEYEAFNFYDVYSVCNISVIYTVAIKHPEAGAFAPCSLYLYNKKDTNTIEMAFPAVYNWIASLAIEDKESVKELMTAQTNLEKILTELTAKYSSK
ncbi:DUF302 domain-containing protein [Sulfurovum sp.]|uniref:DUF302 domain-containing protein n=1 Tax=Sulfurovum sp. TaxID=1969726 RepID=UPI00286838F8|nr:DUF302 domain-containing protein [Sulfurovum sp.]